MFFRMVYKSGQIFLPFCHNVRVWRTDKQTDRQTEFSSLDRVCIACSAVKMCKLAQVIRHAVAYVTCLVAPVEHRPHGPHRPHRPFVSIQLCLVLLCPSSSSGTWSQSTFLSPDPFWESLSSSQWHVRVSSEDRCVTHVPWHGHEEWLISITSRVCCRCRYEPDRPICCLVDQDDASSPDQASDQVIGDFGNTWVKTLTYRNLIFAMRVRLQSLQVKFVYQGHRNKVKVTRAKCVRGWCAFDWKAILFVFTCWLTVHESIRRSLVSHTRGVISRQNFEF